MTQISKTQDLPPIVTAYDMLNQKEKDAAASDGRETSRRAADGIDIGGIYNGK